MLAPLQLPGWPGALEAPPSGVEWMEHELKLGAGPESPTSSYFVEDVRPKVCLPEAGRQCIILLLAVLKLLASGCPAVFALHVPAGEGAAKLV